MQQPVFEISYKLLNEKQKKPFVCLNNASRYANKKILETQFMNT